MNTRSVREGDDEGAEGNWLIQYYLFPTLVIGKKEDIIYSCTPFSSLSLSLSLWSSSLTDKLAILHPLHIYIANYASPLASHVYLVGSLAVQLLSILNLQRTPISDRVLGRSALGFYECVQGVFVVLNVIDHQSEGVRSEVL